MKKILIIFAAALMMAACFKIDTPLSLNPSSMTLKVGESKNCSPTFDGDAVAITSLKSEDYSIASVKGTTVTGVAPGKTRIFVQELDANENVKATAYCNVTVTE